MPGLNRREGVEMSSFWRWATGAMACTVLTNCYVPGCDAETAVGTSLDSAGNIAAGSESSGSASNSADTVISGNASNSADTGLSGSANSAASGSISGSARTASSTTSTASNSEALSASVADGSKKFIFPALFLVSKSDAARIMNKVDELVSKRIYDVGLSNNVWPKALQAEKAKILASTNLQELSDAVNAAIHELKSSHCQFVTINDETFYFLHSLFSSFDKKLAVPKMDYTGVITGGVKSKLDQVRYVVDGGPGDLAGLRRGDRILAVDGDQYVGQANFWGRSGKSLELKIVRDGKTIPLKIIPKLEHDYKGYCDGIEKSVKIFATPSGKIGYVHLWAGGGPSHDVFENVIVKNFLHTDGLILDFRDGYGGNSIQDVDFFNRSPAAYPIFEQIERDGKKHIDQEFYDKPIVALTNGGSRSGKELLSYSFKVSGRAKLIGEKTAGAVLAGRLFPIDDRTALYLAVSDVKVGSVRLEGNGVAPDVEVIDDAANPEGYNRQLDAAKSALFDVLGKKEK
jgi:carboxyl-terminal processing protease